MAGRSPSSQAARLDEIRSEIGRFVGRAMKGRPIAEDDDIFATGAVNSLFAMELIVFVESSFSITVETDDLQIENFRTIGRLAELVARKQGAA